MSPSSESGRPKDPSSDAMPPRVPEHELIRCVGAGSYGQVWLARSVLGSWRAVKVVHRRLFREDRPYDREYLGVQRFEPLSREDEGFVDILQTGRNDEGGYFYYVMELADDVRTPSGRWDGDPNAYEPRTLSRVLAEQGRLPLEECVELGLALCRALGRLHEAGLIHRDVKPSNVIYVDGRPRLADIGLVVEQSEANSWVGTEGFIPPEGPNSPQADLYSLGKVLYVAMTGLDRADFPSLPMGLGTGPEGRRYMELNSLLLRACAAALGGRYATAVEMGADLELLKSGGSVRQRRRRWSPAVRRMMGVGAMLGVVGLVGVWWGRWMRERETQRIPDAAVAASRGNGQGSTASALTAMGIRRLEEEDDSAALVYFSDALAAATAAGEPTEIHRLRLGAVRDRMPRLAAVIDVVGDVSSVDFSPDGRQVATADSRGAVTVWEAGSGRRLHGPHAPSGFPVKVRIAPDGRRLLLVPEVRLPAMRGVDKPIGTARVLDIATGLPLVPDVAHIFWGVFSPDGRWLATIGTGNSKEIRAVGEAGSARRLDASPAPVSWMEFSPDGTKLCAVGDDEAAWLWSVSDGRPICESLPIGGYGMRVVFSPSGSQMATLSMDSVHNWTVRVWDWSKGQIDWQSSGFASPGPILDFGTPGGRRILTGNSSGSISLQSLGEPSGALVEIRPGKGSIRGWAVSADGRRVAAGSEDGSVKIWNIEDARALTPVLRHPDEVRHIALSRDGARLLTATRDGVVRIWELEEWGLEMPSIDLPGVFLHLRSVYTAYPHAIAASGKQVVFGMLRKGARVPVALDPRTGMEMPLPKVGEVECGSLVSGQRHERVAMHRAGGPSTNGSNEVLLMSMESNRWEATRLPHPHLVMRSEFLEEDRSLVTLDVSHTLRIWDATSGQMKGQAAFKEVSADEISLLPEGVGVSWVDEIEGKIGTVVSDSRARRTSLLPVPKAVLGRPYPQRAWLMAAITRDWPLQDWSGSEIGELPFPGEAVIGMRGADFHPGFQRALFCNDAGTTKLIDLGQRKEVQLAYQPQTTPIRSLHFDASGRFILRVDQEGGVSVLDAASGEPILPRLRHTGGVCWAILSPEGMLVTGSLPNRIRRWQLRPAAESPEKLRAQAEALAGRRIDDRGQLVWLAGTNLVQRLR
jgi:WD40 repeat protein